MGIYSHSKLSTFEQCQFKYKLKYLDKIKPLIEKTIESHLGNCIHNSLEWLYNKVKEGKIPTIDDIIVYYATSWQQEYKENILIVRGELNAKNYFNQGIGFLMNYYSQHSPFDDGTIECEKKIIIDLGEDIKIYGFVDRLVYNMKTGEYEIHDYKTANMLPTQEKIENDRQLALYSIAIKEEYGGDKEVCLVWHYLAHNSKICVRKNKEQLEQLKKETLELIKKIESAKDFPPSKSSLCHWCEYKPICPEWNGNLKSINEK